MFKTIKKKINEVKISRLKKLTVSTPWYQNAQNQVNHLRKRVIDLENQKSKEKTYVDELIKDLNQYNIELLNERDNYKEAADKLAERLIETEKDLEFNKMMQGHLKQEHPNGPLTTKKIKTSDSPSGSDFFPSAASSGLTGPTSEHNKELRKKIEEIQQKTHKEGGKPSGKEKERLEAELQDAIQQERDTAGHSALFIKAVNNRKRIEDQLAGFRPVTYPDNEKPVDTKSVQYKKTTYDFKDDHDDRFEPWNGGVIQYGGSDSQGGPLGASRAEVEYYSGGRFRIKFYDSNNVLLNPTKNEEERTGEIVEPEKTVWQRFKEKLSKVCDTEVNCQ